MTETIFEKLAAAVATLKLDFSSEEFALYAEEHELSELEMAAVENVFTYLSEKKQQATVHTLLRLSRLPTKAPRTFENFDFSLLKGRDRTFEGTAIPQRHLLAQESGIYWPCRDGQDSFGASIWLRLLPARYENLLH